MRRARAAVLTVLGLAWLATGQPAGQVPAAALALFLPLDLRGGDRATVTVVDAKTIADIPIVRAVKLPPLGAGAPPASLVLPNGTTKPIDGPAIIDVPRGAREVRVRVETDDGKRALDRAVPVVPVDPKDIERIPPGAALPQHYRTRPVMLAGTQMITGPFDGDYATTAIQLDDRAVPVLAETPRAVWFAMPEGVTSGQHALYLRENGVTAAFPIAVLNLAMSADQLHLLRGQSTGFRATISGPERLNAASWRAGDPSAMVPLDEVRRLAPSFRMPSAGEPGVIFFAIENVSRDTVTISPSQDEKSVQLLDAKSFAGGPFTYSGVAQSKRTGQFSINGLVVAFLEEIAGEPAPPGAIPVANEPANRGGRGTVVVTPAGDAPPPKAPKGGGKIVITAAGDDAGRDEDPCPCYAQVMWSRLNTVLDVVAFFKDYKKDYYHAALIVQVKEGRECPRYVVELTSAVEPGDEAKKVGQVIRHTDGIDYGIRKWRNGRINEGSSAASSGGGAARAGDRFVIDCDAAKRMLGLVESAPKHDWLADTRHGTWTSNSFIAWLLTKSGLDASSVRPPAGENGDAYGWKTGVGEANSPSKAGS
jgi:hypothetical protein